NGTVSFNAQTNTVTFTPTTGYTGAASFSYAIADGQGGTATATVSLTVNAPANQPPVANNDSGYNTTQNTALAIAASTLLANDTDPNGDPLTVTGVSGGVNGTVSFNAQT
ncbi:cadherin-like domain-containing protein, partial [Bradyrhizobium sp. CCH5-F6]|uniref:Ig-like domain-containing protein n=1 Tax=Bradyrhizobium sp. CCH5-F6 TaxID=1768753 RepID=UPI000A5C8C06